MSDEQLEMARREFLRSGGSLLVLSMVLGSGLTAWPRPAQPAALQALSDADARTLLVMTRTLFPHDMLDDGYYMAVVQSIDAKAAGDAKTRAMVAEGIAALNGTSARPFVELSERGRVAVVTTLEGGDFFGLVYGETINGLYGNHAVWAMFGYEGSSVEKGGYLGRGFDDIAWLPKQN
jgi:hypothetical protein